MDSSVWMDYLGGTETRVTGRLSEVLDSGVPFDITGAILQEVVQGVVSREELEEVSEYLGSQTFYHPQDSVESYKEATRICCDCRRAGITIRYATGCLVARVAIEHGLILLHDDRDFEAMAGVVPDLTLA